MFFNSLGGAISISIAQNVFSNSLLQQVPKHTTGVDPALIIGTGATSLRHIVPPNQLQGVLIAYANALDRAFILPIAVGGAAFVISLFVSSYLLAKYTKLLLWFHRLSGILSKARKLLIQTVYNYSLLFIVNNFHPSCWNDKYI